MKYRVLIIDDSLTVRMDLKEMFESADFEVLLAATAAEGREALSATRCDLLVLDVLLPDADGVTFLAELRDELAQYLPVILLSTEDQVKDRIRGLKTGADEYIGKPYDAAHLLGRAKQLLGYSSQPRDRLKILVIDDSITFRSDLSEHLVQAGYETEVAADGETGLRVAAEVRPDGIVVDGVLPGIDGASVVRRIRLDPGLQQTPCLLLTGAEDAAGEILALDAGADGFARKSEDISAILARLSAMLRTAEQSRDKAHGASLMEPKTILAVDDSQPYLEELAEQLRRCGYEVVKAGSGEEALELLAVQSVDGILLDVMLPGLSGIEVCRRIKGSALLRNLPLIMLTAIEEHEAMIEGINAGADDYVTKSSDFSVVAARLRAQLRRKHYEDENRRVREELLSKESEARAAHAAADARQVLTVELERKNAALATLNEELETFAYSVSHDLRQPLRSMDGFSKVLLENCRDRLDPQERHYLERIRAGAQKMGSLIDGLLVLSRVSRRKLQIRRVSISNIAEETLAGFSELEPGRSVDFAVQEQLEAEGDPQLIQSALENLLGNAWKFTSECALTRIEIGAVEECDGVAFFVRDNGAGFEMKYADKLFGPFQRLHSADEYPGTGIGLATVQRIVHRHQGRIWAQSSPGEGATFYFTLPGGRAEC